MSRSCWPVRPRLGSVWVWTLRRWQTCRTRSLWIRLVSSNRKSVHVVVKLIIVLEPCFKIKSNWSPTRFRETSEVWCSRDLLRASRPIITRSTCQARRRFRSSLQWAHLRRLHHKAHDISRSHWRHRVFLRVCVLRKVCVWADVFELKAREF